MILLFCAVFSFVYFNTFFTDLITEHLNPDLENETLRPLVATLPEFIIESRAGNTVKAYTVGYQKWEKWAKNYRVNPIPGNSITLALYFLSLIQADTSLPVIENSFYGIKYMHKTLLKDDPTENILVKELIEVAKRKNKKRTNRKLPLTIENITDICKKLNDVGNSLQTSRTVTMMILAFMGFLRFDEVSKIRCSDLHIAPTHLKIFLESSKTDCYRNGKWVHIAANESSTCPVKAIKNYIRLAELDLDKDGSMFLFRAISSTKTGEKLRRQNKPISYTRVREFMLTAIKSIGLDGSLYGTHSLRAGGATFTANAGIPDRLFKKHGRWVSDKSKDIYVQENIHDLLAVTKTIFVDN